MINAMNNLNELYEAILAGKLEQAVSVTREAVAGGVVPQEIINEYMIKAMEAIGARFESGQVFVPNLLMSARAMRGALDILKPLMQEGRFVHRQDCDWYGQGRSA
jgi:methanogenic corrinoid protein MtbC1